MIDILDVRRFEDVALRGLLHDHSHSNRAEIADKAHIDYLLGYLERLGCAWIVVEHDYVDRNFLEDYAAYYVRCFEDYDRKCVRLHFFRDPADEPAVAAAILNGNSKALSSEYLGFLVIKPLPVTVIGRTCLRTYGEDTGRTRSFPTLKEQMVNFFGLTFQIETLPFQEQDSEVAACASSALWTVLHTTARLFQHPILSPVEITKAGSVHSRIDERSLPNGSGLNPLQIADAIRSVGLEPLGVDVSATLARQLAERNDEAELAEVANAQLELKIAAMAYLRSGIACMMLSRIYNSEMVKLGQHAVALTGFGTDETITATAYRGGTMFEASRVDRLYVHDDQIGPFASLYFRDYRFLCSGKPEEEDLEDGTEQMREESPEKLIEPVNLMLPLYHKIRIPLPEIVRFTVKLDSTIEEMRHLVGIDTQLVWDIQLNDLATVRQAIARENLPPNEKLRLLTTPLPRFIWRVSARLNGALVFELLLDATDLVQGDLIREIVVYQDEIVERYARFLKPNHRMLPTRLRQFARLLGRRYDTKRGKARKGV